MSEVRMERFRAKKEVKDFCTEFLGNVEVQQFISEQKAKRKNKLNIV
jgi:hypothetical protein